MSISEKLETIKRELPADVELVAVSKFHPESDIMEAYRVGQRAFGENIAQELHSKALSMPKDIRWHFIGHLQRNKVKMIAPFVSMIQGVDSAFLLDVINKEALKAGKKIDCLLQIHVAKEESKFGLSFEECRSLLADGKWRGLAGVRLCGLMCIATNTQDEGEVSREFRLMGDFFNEVKQAHFADEESFNVRSWGMSGDYRLAIASGCNMVRIGTAIFGSRPVR